MTELIKLLPEGSSVIAVIVVVVLFLKQQREQAKQIEQLNIFTQTKMKEIADSFQAQIDRLANQIFENEKLTRNQMQSLFDGFLGVSKETISAVVELKGAVESLARQVNKQISKQ